MIIPSKVEKKYIHSTFGKTRKKKTVPHTSNFSIEYKLVSFSAVEMK